MGRERLETEFGQFSVWLAEAIAAAGFPDPIPAACRGTADPALFEGVAGAIGLTSSTRFLDIGCGIGGPGAWIARRFGCPVTGVDVMEAGVQGAARLFPQVGYVVASARSLPFADSSFDAAWALGVLETIAGKAAALEEMIRVLKPGGRVGIYGFVGTPEGLDSPRADALVPRDELLGLLSGSGFELVESRPAEPFKPPNEWKEAEALVRSELDRAHAGEPRYESAIADRKRFSKLYRDGLIEPWVHIAEAPS